MKDQENTYAPKDKLGRQTIQLDESLYEDDDDMLYLLNNLKDIANDSRIRKEMDREDEIFAAMANHNLAAKDNNKKE